MDRLLAPKSDIPNSSGVRMVALLPFYSSDKARRELGHATRPIEETFQRSIDYFRETG